MIRSIWFEYKNEQYTTKLLTVFQSVFRLIYCVKCSIIQTIHVLSVRQHDMYWLLKRFITTEQRYTTILLPFSCVSSSTLVLGFLFQIFDLLHFFDSTLFVEMILWSIIGTVNVFNTIYRCITNQFPNTSELFFFKYMYSCLELWKIILSKGNISNMYISNF